MGTIDSKCAQCGLYQQGAKCPNMAPSGSAHPLLYILGMAPGREEDKKGTQFVGKSGKRLRRLLKQIGVVMKRVRFYNVINCLPPGNKFSESQLKICSQRARDDIAGCKPAVVLVLGAEAANGLWPDSVINSWKVGTVRGATVPLCLDGETWITVVPTYHPSYIIRGTAPDEHVRAWESDVAIAWDWAAGKLGDIKTDVEQFGAHGYYDPPVSLKTPRTFSQVRECLAEIKDQEAVAWDWETYQLLPWNYKYTPSRPEIFSAAFALSNNKVFSFLLGKDYWSKQALHHLYDFLGKWLSEACPGQKKIAHSLKFELLWSAVKIVAPYQGVKPLEATFTGDFHDTKLLAWLLDGRSVTTGLKEAAWKYLGVKRDWSVDVRNIERLLKSGVVTVPQLLTYNAWDAWWTLKLYYYFEKAVLGRREFNKVYRSINLPAAWSFLHTELRGKPVDLAALGEFKKKFDIEETALLKSIREEVGSVEFNPKSNDQLAHYWVNDCKYKLLRKTKKGWSVDATTVQHVADTYNDGVARSILELRKVTKLNSTYVTGLEPLIVDDDRVHSTYSLTVAITGRTACSKPNDQNFPKRKYKQLRRLITALAGHIIASFDYGQIEGRLLGVLTGDPAFCEALWHNYDIHMDNSIWLFDNDKEMGAKMRGIVKQITFGIIYGGGPSALASGTDIAPSRIGRLRKRLFKMFPEVRKWQSKLLEFEREWGYVESLFGVRRRSPMMYSEILNHPNQSTASDMTKQSKNVLFGWQPIILFIHDDLSFLLEESVSAEVLLRIARVMLTVPWLFMKDSPWLKTWVPMEVEACIGPNWCDLEEVLKVSSLDFNIRSLDEAVEVAMDELAFLEANSRFPWKQYSLKNLLV